MKSFRIADYQHLTDRAYLNTAYTELLGRHPDPKGMQHYLADLANGASRGSVAARLRYSPEGKRHGKPLLFGVFYGASWLIRKVPVVGLIWNWLMCFIFLPSHLQDVKKTSHNTNTEYVPKSELRIEDIEQLLIQYRPNIQLHAQHTVAKEMIPYTQNNIINNSNKKLSNQIGLLLYEHRS